MKKRIFSGLLMGMVAVTAMGQVSKTLSPYSQFGLGVLADQSQGFNRGMSGLAIGLRNGKTVNVLNPASYSAVDSLTFIFDMGVSGQLTNFKEGGTKLNRKTADFDYAVALFRVLPHLGVSFGVVPFSNIGYSYSNTVTADGLTTASAYSGNGGLSQAFVGVGGEVVKGLSLGANFSYLWGDITHSLTSTPSDAYARIITKTYDGTVRSYKLDFGVQYQQQLGKSDVLTLGATLGLGHKLGAQSNLTTLVSETQNGTSFSTTDSIKNAYSIPLTLGFGATLVHKNSLTLGADYSMQRWGSLDWPDVTSAGYVLSSGLLKDRHKVTLGADWIPQPNEMARAKFYERIHYRAGVSYATPYYNIKGQDGPKELCVSAGFGIPLVNVWNNRSFLNISAQWVHNSASNFITENTFRINIGLTFNERWFAKWKVD